MPNTNASNSAPQALDRKKHKQERDKARAAARSAEMTNEQRSELNKKRREAYHAKIPEEISARS